MMMMVVMMKNDNDDDILIQYVYPYIHLGRVQWLDSTNNINNYNNNISDNRIINKNSNNNDNRNNERIVTKSAKLYVTGWLKRGSTGIIASNIPDAKETANSLIEDIEYGVINEIAIDDNDDYDGDNRKDGDDSLNKCMNKHSDNVYDSSSRSSSSDRRKYFLPYLRWMKTSPSYNHHHRDNYDINHDFHSYQSIEKFSNIITWNDYQHIEAKENEDGEKMSPVKKIRKKILTYDEFFKSY